MLHCFKAALQENKEIFQRHQSRKLSLWPQNKLFQMSLKLGSSLKSISSQSIRKPIPRLFTSNDFINMRSLSLCPPVHFLLFLPWYRHNRPEWHQNLDFSMFVQKNKTKKALERQRPAFQALQLYCMPGQSIFNLLCCKGNPDNISKLLALQLCTLQDGHLHTQSLRLVSCFTHVNMLKPSHINAQAG